MKLEKFIGRDVEIIYLARNGKITQRCIAIRSVHDDRVKAFCLEANAPRVFLLKNILAFQPIRKLA